MPLNAIIFSKDKPMQLHLLLESILLNFDVEDYKLNILYNASNDEYNRGYNTIRDLYPQFTYKKEESFKSDLLSLFNDSKYTVFFTDDDIIYNPLRTTNEDLFNIFQFSNANCFSLRLGLNTINSYTTKKVNKLNKYDNHSFYHDIELIEPIISWKVSDGTNDYSHLMSLDGHIFKTEYIKNLSETLEYTNPNLFEIFLTNFTKSDMIISSYEHSKLVKNVIKTYSNEDLNEMYLDGTIINFNKLNFTEINSSSQEIKPIFKIKND